jgi:uncharacterized protein
MRTARIIAEPVSDREVVLYHSLLNTPQKLEFADSSDRDSFLLLVETNDVETGLPDLDELLSLSDDEARERARLLQACYTQNTRSKVNWFSLMTAEVCNLGCSYCIAGRNMADAASKHSPLMPWDIAKAGIDWYHDLVTSTQRIASINFSGGEPLANREVTLKAVKYARELFGDFPLDLSINTNATLVDEKVAAVLSATRVVISTSLDGVPTASDTIRFTRAGLGASASVLAGWRKLLDVGCELTGFMATVNDKNFAKLDSGIIDFSHQWGFSWLRVSYDIIHLLHIPVAEAVERAWSIYKYGQERGINVEGFWTTPVRNLVQSTTGGLQKAFFCGAVSGETLSMHPDGRVSACGFSSDSFGNIRQPQNLQWLANRELIHSHFPGDREFCRGCEIEGSCAGGCYISRELSTATKDDSAIRYNCELYRAMTKKLLLHHFRQ